MGYFKKLISVIMAFVLVITMLPVTLVSASNSEAEGTFKCAWFNETLTYPYEYNDSYFDGSALEYHHDLAEYALCVAMASFNSFDKEKGDEHIKALLEECGFEVNSYGYDTEDYDTVGVAIGKKLIGGENVLIFAVRSGNYGMEWGGNLRVGTGDGDHEGFRIAADILIGYINTYFKEHPCTGKTKILIPGYSRGGSITNLAAAALDDGSYADVLGDETDYIKGVEITELFAYTFEAPQCTTSTETKSDIYKNIFNIVNPNDYVPMFVMDEWGFDNYGVRIELPSADNCSDYNSYYERVCTEFDSYMGVNDRKAKNCFYSEEDSKSIETTLNYIFSDIADEITQGRDYFAENYENSLVFFAGQYLGKRRKLKNFAKTMGLIALGTALGLKFSNLEAIKSEGYRKYLSTYLAAHNGGELSEKEIEGTFEILLVLLKYINKNQKDVISLFEQLNTVAQVHQPFIGLAWMRALNEDDIKNINGYSDDILRLSCTSVTLKCNVHGKLVARYDESLGYVEWKSADESIVSVDENGKIYGNDEGKTTITATLYTEDGIELEQKQVNVEIELSFLQSVKKFIKQIIK